jgi:uncharacterized membrane protein
MGMALSVLRSRERGLPEALITKDLLIRGLVLILMDWTLMAPIYWAPFMFLVLCCIGLCTLCFTGFRFLPKPAIGLLACAIIGLAPWYAPRAIAMDSNLLNYPIYIWTAVALSADNWFLVLYPIFPWLGIFALGWFIGMSIHQARSAEQFARLRGTLVVVGLLLIVAALGLRASGIPYAERIPLNDATIADPWFWQFAKYPPSLVFMLLTLGILLTALGILRFLDRSEKTPLWCKAVSVYGRTALFFFVVHFWMLATLALLCGFKPGANYPHRFSFPVAYSVWVSLVLLLWPVCYGYDKLRQRYRSVLRYF